VTVNERTVIAEGRLIDISAPLIEELPQWPGSPGVRCELMQSLAGGDDANVSLLEMDVHCGTHIDAPAHMLEGGATMGAVDLDRLNGPTYVAEIGPAEAIEPADLERAAIPSDTDRVLLRTQNSEDETRYKVPFTKEFSALTTAAAEWLRDRDIRVVGIDYLSIQRFEDPIDTHLVLLGAGVSIIEGLDLGAVESGWYEMLCLPLSLPGAEAAPARVALRVVGEADGR
jgi:arylformamidase